MYLRLTYNNERKNLATGFIVHPSKWDTKKWAVKGSRDDTKQINEYILQSQSSLKELFNEMLKNRNVHLEILVDRFLGKDSNNHTLMELVDFHNKDFKVRKYTPIPLHSKSTQDCRS